MVDDESFRCRFEAQGWVSLPGLLTAEECASFLALARGCRIPPRDWNKGHAASARPWYELAALPELLDRLEPLLGSGVVLWGASLVVRGPGEVHPWHTDIESSAPRGGMVSVWIGLENTRAETSLAVVGGSHRWALTVQEVAARKGVPRAARDDREIARWAAELEPGARVTGTALADGDALFFDGRLWHGSHNTDPAAVRTAVLLQYAAPDAPVRLPDFTELDWPFRWLAAPSPPCLLLRGDAVPGVHRLVPPPDREGPAERPRLGTRIQALPVPLDPAPAEWRPHPLFALRSGDVEALGCHVSGLRPGCSPHPPHRHAEEEILLLLDGEADLVLPELPAADGGFRHRVRRGQFAYYPAEFPHTLEAVGDRPATYFMLKWLGAPAGGEAPLAAAVHDLGLDRPAELAAGSPPRVLFDGATGWLGRFHAHLSTVAPGNGYEPHVDAHDVILVTLEGEIETLGASVGPHRVVVYGAGEPHGLRARGAAPARYLVFEMDGRPRARRRVAPVAAEAESPHPAAAPDAAPAPVPPSAAAGSGPRPLPLRVALHALAHSLVYWLRGRDRRAP